MCAVRFGGAISNVSHAVEMHQGNKGGDLQGPRVNYNLFVMNKAGLNISGFNKVGPRFVCSGVFFFVYKYTKGGGLNRFMSGKM